jgi:integrase
MSRGRPRITLGRSIQKASFNGKVWQPARENAGIPARRDGGMHQLRHHYASMLLRGIDIKRVQSYPGHHSAAITLGYYAHVIPDDDARSLREIQAALAGPSEAPQLRVV